MTCSNAWKTSKQRCDLVLQTSQSSQKETPYSSDLRIARVAAVEERLSQRGSKAGSSLRKESFQSA